MIFRATHTTRILELQEWCSEYNNAPRCTTRDPVRRFMIGFYQLNQSICWKDSASADESKCAAALHFLMVGELLGCHIEQYVIPDISKLRASMSIYNKLFLTAITSAAKHIIYGTNAPNIKRRSRYDKNALSMDLGVVIQELLSMRDVGDSLYHAMEVMCGEI